MEGETWTAAITPDGVLLAPKDDSPAVLSYVDLYRLLMAVESAQDGTTRLERVAVEAYGEFGAAIEVGYEEDADGR
jgi:hypothetical protein